MVLLVEMEEEMEENEVEGLVEFGVGIKMEKGGL